MAQSPNALNRILRLNMNLPPRTRKTFTNEHEGAASVPVLFAICVGISARRARGAHSARRSALLPVILEAPLSAFSRTSRPLAALALPFLALLNFPACSSEISGNSGNDQTGTGGSAIGTGGETTGVGGASTTGGATATGGVANPGAGGASAGGAGGSSLLTGGAPGAGGIAGTGATEGSGGALGSGGSLGSGGGPIDVECTLPDLPEPGQLTEANPKLPDPFTFFDGTKVTTKAQWECRRKEILAMAAKYLYGPVPGEPDMVTGTVSGGMVTMNVTVGGETETFSATIGSGNDVIALSLSGGVVPGGSKALSFGGGFEGKITSLFGLSELNPNIANGWMIDRVMDVLEQNPDSGHDPKKMVVSGCSGCGKGAFLAGVFSRIPVTVIVESGGGGATSWRMTEWFRHGGGNSSWQCGDLPQGIDNLEDSGICGPWVTGAASWVRSSSAKVNNLPIDQHLLLASMAPRYVVHFTNNNGPDSWCHLAGTSEALAAWAAKPVWNALGVPERFGFSMYSANHCTASSSQTALAGEMFKLAFEGDTSANTDVMDIPANGVQQPVSEWKDMWIDWDMETVLQ